MSWILIIFIHAGMLSEKDSVTMTNVPGFKTEAACLAAGKQADALVKRTTKEVKFICAKAE